MLSAGQITALSIEDLKTNFFDLMNGIVTAYGDDQQEEADEQQQEREGDHAE